MLSKSRKSISVRAFTALLMFVSCVVLTVGLLPSASPRAAASIYNDYLGWDQVGWPTPSTMREVSAINGNDAWATDGTSVFRLFDGGNAWVQFNPGGNTLFDSVSGIDSTSAWATAYRRYEGGASEEGLIVKITEGGRVCEFQPSGTTEELQDISAVDATTAWAVGANNTIIKTEDGGATWTPQMSGITGYGVLEEVSAVDSQVAWTVSSTGDYVLRTVDGGATWAATTVPGTYTKYIEAVSADVAWATQYNHIYKTTDGGQTWTTQFTTDQYQIQGLSANDENSAWATGGVYGFGVLIYGVVLNTTDGGTNWVTQPLGCINTMSTISTGSLGSVWVGGNGSVLIRKGGSDQGWGQVQCAVLDKLHGLSATSAGTAWVCGDQGLVAWVNTNGGFCVLRNTISGNLRSISAQDTLRAWTVGSSGNIFFTLDGGFNWIQLQRIVTATLYGVKAVDDQTLWAVGESGTILKSSDGGTTWGSQISGTTAILYDISAIDANTAWAVGAGGVVLNTIDGGATWLPQASAPTDLYAVEAVDAQNLWVAGGSVSPAQATLLKSTDGGVTWTPQSTGESNPLVSLSAVNAGTAWTVSTATSIFNTVDGGAFWNQQLLATANSERASRVDAVDAEHGWALIQGRLYYTINGGEAPPDLYLCIPFYGTAGDDILITGKNLGSLQGSSSVTFGTVEAAGYKEWSYDRIVATVPSGLAGEVVISVTTPAGSVSFFSKFSTECPPLSLTSATPASSAQGYTVHLTLAGNGFKYGTSIRLVQGETTITATNINMTHGASIVCDVNLTGANLGAYDVVVTNPDGQEAVLTGGFNVTLPLACGAGATGTLFVIGGMMGLISLGHAGRRRMRRRASKRS